MKLSEHSLRNWIGTALTIEVLSKQLTISGLEVEEIQIYVKNFKNVIIGEIVKVECYSKVNSLFMIQVNIGIRFVKIISNINNLKKNMKICFLYKNKKLFDHSVKKFYKIHEEYSKGIICTFTDLGILNYKNEIVILPYSAPVGLHIKDYNFYKDKIIKINTTFNRVDVFGSFGIARELCILNNLPFPKIMNFKIPVLVKEKCKIYIENSNMIYSCFGRLIRNIDLNKKTPIWMQEKLRKSGINSINIVIDIINYVFLELGQSIYVFSFSKDILDIIVSTNNKDILFKTNKTCTLDKNILILKNKVQILSFLGNIDFNLFPIDLNNNSIFIGSFFIDPEILSTSVYYIQEKCNVKLHEYFVDPGNQKAVLEYTTKLFLEICGGYASKITSKQSQYYKNYMCRKIKLSYKYILKFVGYEINFHIVENILVKLGYYIILKNSFWYVIPPSWRPDILIPEDVISDIIRIYQYDNILPKPFMSNSVINNTNNILESTLKRAQYALIDRGYYEVINYSFVDPKVQKLFHPDKKFLYLLNPISKDMSCMRCSIWSGLIKNLIYHQNHQYDEVRFFESGLCFIPHSKNKLGVKQNIYFSGIIGNIGIKKFHWDLPARIFDFYDLKGDVEAIFDSIGYLENITFKKKKIPGLHDKNSTVIILNNKIIGNIGELDPILMKSFNIHYSTFLFELFWYKLDLQHTKHIHKISDFPQSKRDISIILDENILVGDLVVLCLKKFFSEIDSIQILDIYTGSTIQHGKKSVTLVFLFQNMYKTLTDKYIDNIMNRCIFYLYEKFNAVLRS